MRVKEVLLKTPTPKGDDYPDKDNLFGDHEISADVRTPTVVQNDSVDRSVDQSFSETKTYVKGFGSLYNVFVNMKSCALKLSNVYADGTQALVNYLHKNSGIKIKEENLKHGDAHPGAFEALTDDGEIEIKLESLRDPDVAESETTNTEGIGFKAVRETYILTYILNSRPLNSFSTGKPSNGGSEMKEDSESLRNNGIIDGNVVASVTSNGTIQISKQNLIKNGSIFSEQKMRVCNKKKNCKASIEPLLTLFLGFLSFINFLLIKLRSEIKCNGGHSKQRIHLENLLLCCLCICLFSCMQVADGKLENVPKNTVSLMNNGSQTKMECRSDRRYQLKWYSQSNSSSKRKELYNGYSVNSEASSYCHVENGDSGKDILCLTSVEEAAQTYTCLEPGSLEVASADLILIGETNCEINSVDSYIKITCSVPFRGNWAPVLEWKHNEEVLTDNVTSSIVPNRKITSTMFFPSLKFGASNYTCTTKFNVAGKPLQTTDNSVPSYAYVWNIANNDASNDEGMSPSTTDVDVIEDSDQQVSSHKVVIIIGLLIGLLMVCIIVAVLFKRCCRKLPNWNCGKNCKQNPLVMGNKSDVNPIAL